MTKEPIPPENANQEIAQRHIQPDVPQLPDARLS